VRELRAFDKCLHRRFTVAVFLECVACRWAPTSIRRHLPAAAQASDKACAGTRLHRTRSGSSDGIARRSRSSAGSLSSFGRARCSQYPDTTYIRVFPVAAVFAAAVRQNAHHLHAVLFEERQHPVIERVPASDRASRYADWPTLRRIDRMWELFRRSVVAMNLDRVDVH
jgi:hypothetical protein